MDGRPVVRVPISGDQKPVVIGVFSLKQGRKSRLLEIFEQHCKSFVSNAYIPGMVAPMLDTRRVVS